MRIRDVMSGNVIAIGPEETVSVAARSLSRHNIGSLPVCTADGKLRGMLTDRDIVLRSVASNEDAGQQTVREIMTRRLVTVSPEDGLAQAAGLMAKERVRRLPVVSGGKLVGMVTTKDLLQAPGMTMEAIRALEGISSGIRRTEG
ncbi:MAG: CBS domain-containing protein [Oscillospiraceae bacterium]|nr:CBS domain-containing protein [Oscillospiraceae bacterium]